MVLNIYLKNYVEDMNECGKLKRVRKRKIDKKL